MDGYLTKQQVAERFQKSLKTITRWCKDGTLPYIKIGVGRTASVFFDWACVKAHLNKKFGYNITTP